MSRVLVPQSGQVPPVPLGALESRVIRRSAGLAQG